MTYEELVTEFDKYDSIYLKFEDVKNKLSSRPDICAFILLNNLCPGTADMVCAAEHDEIFLDVSIEELAKVITSEQVHDLVCCGVRINEYTDSLAMFA